MTNSIIWTINKYFTIPVLLLGSFVLPVSTFAQTDSYYGSFSDSYYPTLSDSYFGNSSDSYYNSSLNNSYYRSGVYSDSYYASTPSTYNNYSAVNSFPVSSVGYNPPSYSSSYSPYYAPVFSSGYSTGSSYNPPSITNSSGSTAQGSTYTAPPVSSVTYNPPALSQIAQGTGSQLYVSCNPNISNPNLNQSVTWTAYTSGGNGSYTYSWTGTNGLTGSNSSVSQSYSTTGTKSATVTVTSNGQTQSATCSANVYDNSNNNGGYNGGYYYYNNNNYGSYGNLYVSCSVNRSTAAIGEQVTWTASASGGNGSYSYYWTGDAPLNGVYGQTQYVTYNTSGSKLGSVTVTSNGQSVTRTCDPVLYVGTSGSSGNGVYLYSGPQSGTPAALTSVYLSQVPYTGAGDVLMMSLYVGLLIILSLVVSVVVVKRKDRNDRRRVIEAFKLQNLQSKYN